MTEPASTPGALRAIATRPAKRAAMVGHDRIAVDAGSGLAGDFHRKPGPGQVTIVALEKWTAACADLGAAVPWTYRRANLLVAGVALDPTLGQHLRIGGVILEITGETEPCSRMDEQHDGLKRALTPDARGGVRCRIVEGGDIAVGDAVAWIKERP